MSAVLLLSVLTVPQLERCIFFCSGRHPLAELLAQDTFIPNDTHLGDVSKVLQDAAVDQQQQQQKQHSAADADAAEGSEAAPRMVLITGPNASGKSVYMKQVRLQRCYCMIKYTVAHKQPTIHLN
eukprot:GHUV01048363.1.p1 GENE.GHUV01048363.1~~GHUV01048363.1.p1  ORF type:complete len:125 (+),score=45.85 GHUV01048363.1:628-1002(+)